MIFQQLLNEESGCLSYLIGCAQAGRAVVVDPGRDRVHDYIRIARKKGLTITDVVETHTHADHISGNRDLAAVTKAAIHVHRAAGVMFPHETLADGDSLRLGNVELRACHAPGHTPDSLCLLVTDHARAAEPWFVLTGDTLFVGSVGRPGLGGASAVEDLWETLRRVLLPLSDGVEVYPAHGAGSSCGRAMSAKAASTIGFERRFNPAFHFDSKARFVDFIMEGVPPKPAAFETIVAKNRGLLPLTAAKPRPMSAREAWEAAQAGAVNLDLRDPVTHGETHPAGALNVWIDGPQFPERVAGFVSPGTRVIVLAQAPSDVDRAVQALSRVGVDDVIGYLQWGMIDWRDAALPVETVPQISAWDLHTLLESGEADVDDDRLAALEQRVEVPGADLRHRLHRQGRVAPVDHAPLEIADHVVDADARERLHRAVHVGRRLGQHDHARARRQEAGDALGKLRAVDPDVERAGRVRLTVRAGIAQVEDDGAGLRGLPRLARAHRPRLGGRERQQAAVLRDDRLEGGWLRRHALHDEVHEPRLAVEVEGGVEAPLEADRRRGLRAHRAPARAAGAVGGIDLDAVGQRQQHAAQRLPQILGRRGAAEVGATDGADEERVAGEHEPRLGGARVIGHEQAERVRGVAGRVTRPQLDVAEAEAVAVRQRLVRERHAGRAVDVDGGLRDGGEVAVARDVIGVGVGLDHVGDGESLLAGDAEVVVDAVSSRVDHHGAPRLGAADQVGQAAGLFVQELLKDHAASILVRPAQCFSAFSFSALTSFTTLSAMNDGTSS